ncbi:hypothetical protein NUU61_007629 [Penicillium alfredii]|uniref:Large ribosomal subunit protein bL17m n=1 Tax=Penicillium alfredii TaxID=1506179 RepID=A0A9W9EQV3_9EURO|nr:uncharacterized protein NUU61_007629 [Penicillium alfredii]KAJ5086322.1 hypothetical protein NUU61_007629 [Penicillium alfredii]
MAGGGSRYRHLSRNSAHRQALLRNLVTSLFEHETITTTWPKAKEAQRLAEKLITLGKKNTEQSRRRALEIFYKPHEIIPKLFGPIRERYADRPGGYTRVLRCEPKEKFEYYSVAKGDKKAPVRKPNDQAPSAILELVDGPRDMRFAMTARAVARQRSRGEQDIWGLAAMNVRKVTRFRKDGVEELESAISKLEIEKAKKSAKESKAAEKNKVAEADEVHARPQKP